MYHHIIQSLSRNKKVFAELLTNIPKEMYLWKPQPPKWCLLEIVCHLYDEEREDFRARTQHTLQTPDAPAPPIDPEGWVTQRAYIQQDYEVILQQFLQERETSVQWLHSLTTPKWDNIYQHPQIGPISAQMFLSNWLAHDYLHIRQILHVKHAYLQEISSENLRYAGEW